MQYAAIPLHVFNSQAYQKLSMPQKAFLIDLYTLFLDCDCFTIEMDKPQDYRQLPAAGMAKKIIALLDAGFIEICGRQKTTAHHSRRIFKFSYPGIYYLDEEDEIFESEAHDTLVKLDGNYETRA